MNVSVLYELISGIVNHTSLEIRLRRVLRDTVLACLVSRSCLLDDLATALSPRGSYESQYRRVQRLLANERLEMSRLQREWAGMVIHQMQPETIKLMVDETALSKHLKIMVLGIWSPDGCIPLAWCSYKASAYPAGGQVKLILDLLDRIRPVVPLPCRVTLLADRGIGTSPDLIRAVDERGLDVLFRVQGTSRFRYPDGREFALKYLGIPGYTWQSVGDVFKKAGWLPLHVCVAWGDDYEHPWCLVGTTDFHPADYADRFDQEVSFRDLKSDGFQWHRSHVWMPDHADRLLLILAIAYSIVLSVGQALAPASHRSNARKSTFRLGLDALTRHFRPTIAPILPKPPLPPPKITSVV